MKIVRTQEEIEQVLNWIAEAFDAGTHYPAMSYEDGIDDMFRWLVGDSEDMPG